MIPAWAFVAMSLAPVIILLPLLISEMRSGVPPRPPLRTQLDEDAVRLGNQAVRLLYRFPASGGSERDEAQRVGAALEQALRHRQPVERPAKGPS